MTALISIARLLVVTFASELAKSAVEKWAAARHHVRKMVRR